MINIVNLFSGVESAPTISSFGYEDLGDNPTTHRWRAQWATGGDGIWLVAYPVIKLTPCGAWINEHSYREATKQWVPYLEGMKKRFIYNDSGQAWAKPTKEEALHSLAIRLCRWTNNIRREVDRARAAAETLRKLRPQEADFAQTAINNLKGIEAEEYWG